MLKEIDKESLLIYKYYGKDIKSIIERLGDTSVSDNLSFNDYINIIGSIKDDSIFTGKYIRTFKSLMSIINDCAKYRNNSLENNEYYVLLFGQAYLSVLNTTSVLKLIDSIRDSGLFYVISMDKLEDILIDKHKLIFADKPVDYFLALEEGQPYNLTTMVSSDLTGITFSAIRTGDIIEVKLVTGTYLYNFQFNIYDTSCIYTNMSDCRSLDIEVLVDTDKKYALSMDKSSAISRLMNTCVKRDGCYQGVTCRKNFKYCHTCDVIVYQTDTDVLSVNISQLEFLVQYILSEIGRGIYNFKNRKPRGNSKAVTVTQKLDNKLESTKESTRPARSGIINLVYTNDSENKVYTSKAGFKRATKKSSEKSPHYRRETVRHLKNGKTTKVKSCIIHKDNYSGATGYMLK